MTYLMCLKESRAQVVVKEMNNDTKIISQPDQDGYVKISVVIDSFVDVLSMYHAGMEAKAQMDREFHESHSAI